MGLGEILFGPSGAGGQTNTQAGGPQASGELQLDPWQLFLARYRQRQKQGQSWQDQFQEWLKEVLRGS